MKAPTDKSNDTIQILVTWSCDLFNCSNCTQILPFRKDAGFMSVDCFREAVRSVKDWPGVVAMFGGNPCVHPRFEELCAILEKEIRPQRRRGIWTNNLMGHGATVRRVFYPHGRFNLNAHVQPKAADEIREWLPGKLIKGSDRVRSWHSPILMDYRDLGVTEEEWVKARERCDINQKWSSAIMERDGKPYAYFCEVAGALDGARNVNNGIPAVPGWWKHGMERFENQVRQCCDAGCGVPLRRLGHLDLDNTYDMTRSWVSRIGLPKGRAKVEVHDMMPEGTPEATDYMQLRHKKGVAT